MLTKKQLQDAANCEKMKCKKCSMNDVCYETVFSCTNALAQTALAYREMLERLEFSNLTWDGAECAICGGRNEHEDGCELAALLKGLEGAE